MKRKYSRVLFWLDVLGILVTFWCGFFAGLALITHQWIVFTADLLIAMLNPLLIVQRRWRQRVMNRRTKEIQDAAAFINAAIQIEEQFRHINPWDKNV